MPTPHHAASHRPPTPSSSSTKTEYDANGKEIIKLPSIDVAVHQSSIWFANAGLIDETTPPGAVGFHGEISYHDGIRHGGDDGSAIPLDLLGRWGGDRERERERVTAGGGGGSAALGGGGGGGSSSEGGGNPPVPPPSDLSNFSLSMRSTPNGLGGGGGTPVPAIQSNGYHVVVGSNSNNNVGINPIGGLSTTTATTTNNRPSPLSLSSTSSTIPRHPAGGGAASTFSSASTTSVPPLNAFSPAPYVPYHHHHQHHHHPTIRLTGAGSMVGNRDGHSRAHGDGGAARWDAHGAA
jgi:hypothetical protein